MISAATRAAARLVRSLVAIAFGAAGAVLGGVAGSLAGFVDEDGLMQGALVGAITGALVSVELADSIARIWCCGDCSVNTRIKRSRVLLRSFGAGRLLRGWVFPTIGGALEIQIDALHPHYGSGDQQERGGDMFEPSYPVMAARRAVIESLPSTMLTKETAGQQQSSCPICLHDFQAGESTRSLPACRHAFHLVCIDGWLLSHSQCPMCRRAVY